MATPDPATVHQGGAWHHTVRRKPMRLYQAICAVIEAWAEHIRTDTLEQEFENADWAKTGGWSEDDDG